MAILGLILAFLGFAMSVLSLGITSSVGVRMAMTLTGLAISLAGILGVLNRAYLKHAIWRK